MVIDVVAVTRLVIILGIINLVAGVLIFFSCRCMGLSKLGNRLMKKRWYQRFYKFHCYLWWIFWPSVFLHAILVITFLGWPG